MICAAPWQFYTRGDFRFGDPLFGIIRATRDSEPDSLHRTPLSPRFATQWQNATHPPPDSGVGRWDQLRGGELFLSCKILSPNVLRQKSSPPSPWRGTRLGGQLPSACHGNHQCVAKPCLHPLQRISPVSIIINCLVPLHLWNRQFSDRRLRRKEWAPVAFKQPPTARVSRMSPFLAFWRYWLSMAVFLNGCRLIVPE